MAGAEPERDAAGGEAPPAARAADAADQPPAKKKKPKLDLRDRAKLEKLKAAHERRGVVYLSRIPPHLRPQKLRQLLSQYAEIGRVYLAPEDPAARRRRKERGGSAAKAYVEGWVEFEDKRAARRAAAALNGQPMDGRRRSAFHYDLWNMRYLPKFKWDHLTEEATAQRAAREQRLAAEAAAAARERDFYLSRVDRAKGVAAVVERKRARAADEGEGGGAAAAAAPVLRTFGQRRAVADPVADAGAPGADAGVLRLLAGRGGG